MILIPLLLSGAAAVVVFSKKLTASLIAMSSFSLMLALYYSVLHAPDVAITEAALGAGLSTLVFLIVINKTREKSSMISLLDYVTETSVFTISEKNHRGILKELMNKTLEDYSENVRDQAYTGILEKSSIQEINLGKGIALSHHRMDSVTGINFALGILDKKTRYFKGPPVKAVFCIIIPEAESRNYLSFMAKLTRFLSGKKGAEAVKSGDYAKIREQIMDFEGN